MPHRHTSLSSPLLSHSLPPLNYSEWMDEEEEEKDGERKKRKQRIVELAGRWRATARSERFVSPSGVPLGRRGNGGGVTSSKERGIEWWREGERDHSRLLLPS